MSRNPGAYKDLGKEASDFLNKNFLESEWKVELNTVAANGSTVKTTVSKADAGVLSSLESKCKHRGAEVTAVFDNNREIKLTVAHKKVLAGLDTSVELTSNTSKLIEGLKLKGSLDYAHDVVTLNSNLTVPLGNGATTSVSSVVLGSKEQGVALGAEVEVNAVRAQVTRFDTIFTYAKGANSLAAFTRTKRDTTTNALAHRVGVNVFHKFVNSPSNANVALEGSYDLKTSQVNFAAAAGYKPDVTTHLKGRLDNSGILSLAYTQNLLAPFTVSTFAKANILNLEGPDAVKLGVKLTYQQ
jgi:voltage-dependent anion channel protein 2